MASLDSIAFNSLLEDITSSLNTTWDYCAIIGVICGSVVIIRCVLHCFRCFKTYIIARLWHCNDFPNTYAGDWAVISGASDGLGRSYAIQLAKRKMNVFLISRSMDKLKKVADEIRALYHVEARCYPLDLCELSDWEKYDGLANELITKRVGVLVNNVGMMYEKLQYFLTVPKERLVQMVDLNVNATVLLTHMILPQMLRRKTGAIINVSSGSTVKPTPLMTAYAATKSFVESFTEALQYEYSSYGITMQVVRPFYVSTDMTFKGKPNVLLVHPDDYAKSALRTLGYTPKTYGYWPHGLFGMIGQLMPGWLYRFSAVHVNPVLWSWLTGVAVDKKTT